MASPVKRLLPVQQHQRKTRKTPTAETTAGASKGRRKHLHPDNSNSRDGVARNNCVTHRRYGHLITDVLLEPDTYKEEGKPESRHYLRLKTVLRCLFPQLRVQTLGATLLADHES